MRVFICHLSSDKPAVKAFAETLRQRGIDPWLDQWEIEPGDDIVKSINLGLDECQAGIIIFSQNTMTSNWVEAEVSYLIYARIQESKVLIPVMLERDVLVPPLIRPLARCNITEVDAVVDALRHRSAGPKPEHPPERGCIHRIELTLQGDLQEGIATELRINGDIHVDERRGRLPRSVVDGLNGFMRGVPAGARREVIHWDVHAYASNLADLGRELADFLVPENGMAALVDLLKATRKLGQTIEWVVSASHPTVLGLPFEAMRLPDGRVLALEPHLVMMRRPAGLETNPYTPLAGPLKILVAVGAPDEDQTDNPVLDHEMEIQNILGAVEPLRLLENAAVRILEVGQAKMIARAIEADAYHVLHVSCHGGPGWLILENELGGEEKTSARDLIEPLLATRRPLPLVFLNACHGGVPSKDTASFAESLLRQGVPAVLAMQTSVSDGYATRLARGFYEHLANRENMLPSRALAQARRELEAERLKAVEAGGSLMAIQPEYATATLYIARDEPQLADFGLDRVPLRKPPVYEMAGPVPQLKIGDLIGRRKQLREALNVPRGNIGHASGLVLTGMGGIGKSALAGRIMCWLKEDGWAVAVFQGKFDLVEIARAMADALLAKNQKVYSDSANLLVKQDLDDQLRLGQMGQLLGEHSILLVLDDFEQNLSQGGDRFQAPEVADAIQKLLTSARKGKLLLTCRHPIPGLANSIQNIKIPPLSAAESRKLALRLPSFAAFGDQERIRVHRLLGGHPRMLELLDALLQGGEARFPHVKEKLAALLEKHDLPEGTRLGRLSESLQLVLTLGMRDIFLKELFDIVGAEERGEYLLRLAVSNLPVSSDGLARMSASDPGDETETDATEAALLRFEGLGLLYRDEEGNAHVPRWTAEGLKKAEPENHLKRCIAAGRYRMWRVEHETQNLADGVEAARNYLEGKAFDEAVEVVRGCFRAMIRIQQIMSVASLAAEVLEVLPEDHSAFASISDQEAQAFLALGQTQYALRRYEKLLGKHEELVQSDPGNADYQRDLSVSYNKVGDLYSALGEGEKARQAFLKSLEIRERLAGSEPERADYQRDLSVSYNKVGDLYSALGEGEKARQAFLKSLEIAERLAGSEPERADYQRDLSVSHERMGSLYSALGEGEKARQAFLKSLEIFERLAASEPERADYQRDLAASYERLGDVFLAEKEYQKAHAEFLKALNIRASVAKKEPERADYMRELVIPLWRLGLFQLPESTELIEKALGILVGLKESGRLKPVDEPMIAKLQSTIQQAKQDSSK